MTLGTEAVERGLQLLIGVRSARQEVKVEAGSICCSFRPGYVKCQGETSSQDAVPSSIPSLLPYQKVSYLSTELCFIHCFISRVEKSSWHTAGS